ncbi:peptidoglycan-binding domain-containing protein [Nannocystis punicea]|uniref:Peptidoglycan-binding domain-containing protein n=1 Tax=Nannocystis punicea TaxID=2995304 RepID=A0ABY7H102_9BACT|nr:peptidoglycan-binding domain-containing protein [Nannocystis poenicansa]WAS92925.1 peptidoglycan-binding domain-containing protein [Nannocystis poenicansa]
MSEPQPPTATQLAPDAAGRAVRRVLDALAVLAEVEDVATTTAAVQALQRHFGLAATGEVTPALLQRAQAVAQAVHADAHVEAATAAETAASLYEQIAGDREREIEAVRARHPGRPTSLTEEEVGASLLAQARCALEAAGHWRRAAEAKAASSRFAGEEMSAGATRTAGAGSDAAAGRAPAGEAGARRSAAAAEAKASEGTGVRAGASAGEAAVAVAGAASGGVQARLAGEAAAVAVGAATRDGAGASQLADAAEGSRPLGAEQALLSAARARARAWRAAAAAGPWFRSAAAGHLAAGDRLQGSRALEGALKAAALVTEATAPIDIGP